MLYQRALAPWPLRHFCLGSASFESNQTWTTRCEGKVPNHGETPPRLVAHHHRQKCRTQGLPRRVIPERWLCIRKRILLRHSLLKALHSRSVITRSKSDFATQQVNGDSDQGRARIITAVKKFTETSSSRATITPALRPQEPFHPWRHKQHRARSAIPPWRT